MHEASVTKERRQTQINELRGMMQSVLSAMQNNPRNERVEYEQRESSARVGDRNETNVDFQESNRNANSLSPYDNSSFVVTRNNCSVREIAETIPDFDPTSEFCMTAEQFIQRVNSVICAYQWEEKCLLLAVYSRMKGVARLWLDASEELHSNWYSFANELKKEFGGSPDEADTHFQMRNAVRRQDEKVSDYCFRVCALGRQYKLSETAIVKYAREGLRNRELQVSIAAQRFHTMKQLRETLNEYERNLPPATTPRFVTKFNEQKTQKNEAYESKYKANNENVKKSLNKTYETKTKAALKCYNCGDFGHYSMNCQKPQRRQRCSKCNKVHGRDETDCKNVAAIRNTFCQNDKHFKVCVQQNKKNMTAFIDTGAQCSMIRKSVCVELEGDRVPCLMKITGICGGVRYAHEMLKTNLMLDNTILPVTLYSVDDELLLSDILLEQDNFIDNLRLTIESGNVKIENLYKAETKTINRIINENQIKCDINDNNVKSELMHIIQKNGNVFASGLCDIGKTDLVKMKIELNTNEVVAQAPYRVPEPKKQIVAQMINELIENDIVVRSESEYASPVVLVKKKNGSDRLCVDYRRVNQLMKKEIFPMPNIEEVLQEASRYKYFTTLDLNSGYYQIEIEPGSRKYTSFITTDGLFEFKRMPFGLKNAPIAFQRLMAKIQERAGRENMIHYMDDILIGSNSYDEMFTKLKIVFGVLRDAKLTLNIAKCEFLKTTIQFLGHQLTPEGLTPGLAKTTAILNFQQPTNVTEIRRFLGLSGYFRKFIPGYAIISEPLRKLLRKEQIFNWTDDQEKAFNELKTKLTSQPVLVAYRVDAVHEIHTDASSIGLAGVLLQDEGGDLKPVAYYSRSTSDVEKNFHSYELETLAVVETLERYRYYVHGKTVKVVTDCSAVKTAMEKRELIPRIARWWLRVQDFDIKLEHRQGHRMEHVDALSRSPNEDANDTEVATIRVDKVTLTHDDWLHSMQIQDDKLKQVIEKINAKMKNGVEDYCVEHGRLFNVVSGKKLWVVPKALRHKMVQDCHDKNGHLSLEKTLDRMKTYLWFDRMRNFVKSYLKSCVECAYNKHRGGQTEGQYHFNEIDPVAFKTIHMDHLGPFTKSCKRNEHILVIVDSFTKYTIIKAVKSTATRHVLTVLHEITSYFGVPERVVTDRGTAFTSKEFKRYCSENDIKHILNAVRTPRANGHAERTNRTLLSMLLPTTTADKKWDENLTNIQWSMNSMKNKTTGKTPHELLFSFSPRDILRNKVLLALHEDNVVSDSEMQKLRIDAAEKTNKQRERAKQRYDEHHSKPNEYNAGDLVLAENEPPSTGTSRKLEPRYKGPFIIKQPLGRDRYLIEDLPNSKRTSRHYTSVYASDKLKPWCQLPPNFEHDNHDDDSNDEHSEVALGGQESRL